MKYKRNSNIINIDIKISKKFPLNKKEISLKKNSKISLVDNLYELANHIHYNTNINNINQNNKNKKTIEQNNNNLISNSSSKNNINNNNKKSRYVMNHSNSFTNLKNQNLSVHTHSKNSLGNKLKDKYLKSKSISKFYLKNNSTINKNKSKPKQIQIPKCNKNNKNIILNIKIGKKNNDSYSIDKTPLKTNHKMASKTNNYYSHTQSYNNINKLKNSNTQSCININKQFLIDKFNEGQNKKIQNNSINNFNYIFKNKNLKNIDLTNSKNIKTDTGNKCILDINKYYQMINDSVNESPINVKIYNNSNNMNYSGINYFYNNFIYNTNDISDGDIIKNLNNLSNYKNKKNIIPNNFIQNKYLLSTYDKISNVFNNINSTRNSINVNVFQNINNNNNNNLNKYNQLKYNSSQNIRNNSYSSFNQSWKLRKKNNNSSINIIKSKKKRKNKSVEIIDKINFNIKNINISNNFIKKIENVKLIKPTYQIKLDIIKRRTINMLEFYINLAKNAVDKSINNNNHN